MHGLILLFHILVCLVLIGLVLMQHGKGAEAGAAFGGGASATIFGSQGSASFLVKFTTILAIIFFLTCLVLSVLGRSQAEHSLMSRHAAAHTSVPAKGG